MLPQLPLTVGPAVSVGESAAADSAAPRRPAGEAPADPFAGLLAGLRVAAGTQANAGSGSRPACRSGAAELFGTGTPGGIVARGSGPLYRPCRPRYGDW